MGKHKWYFCEWDIKHFRNGQIIWETRHQNILVDEGEKAILDTFFRDKASDYFGMTDFYAGLFYGSISESTVLSTIPNEPSGNGYIRQLIERSAVGWPTIEKNQGDWRIISKEITLTASGGNIGPVNGAFLCTSSDNTGVLIGSLSMAVERTILAGDTITMQLKVKLQ